MTPVINDDASAQVIARIVAYIDDGIGAAVYDGDGGHAGPTSSHPERQAIKADELAHKRERDMREQDRVSARASNDLARYQAAVATVKEVSAAYPSITAGQYALPGITPCPKGKCLDCWHAGIVRNATQKRYADRCRRCGDYRKRNGHPIPAEAIKALASCDGDWTHWSVVRALRAG